MTTRLRPGARTWSLTRTREGHRDYKVIHVVECAPTDGPFNVLNTTGLPLPGAPWLFDGDSDPWAFCQPDATARPLVEDGAPSTAWIVEQTFTTKPPPSQRCQDSPVGDPLTEPPKVSGGFAKVTEEKVEDRDGVPIKNSSKEPIRGPQAEFDAGRPTIKIEQHVLVLNLDVIDSMMHTVNDAPLWGMDARCVKLAGAGWEKKYYGACYPYYVRHLEFEVNGDTFDRSVLDEGTLCIRGDWERNTPSLYYGTWVVATDPVTGLPFDGTKPGHFQKFKDWNGENARVILDGHGRPWSKRVNSDTAVILAPGDPDSEPGRIAISYYPESNFLLLGIPAVL